ncbi:hypothetical protein VKT23_015667 [Stygiomarasmius scandens]|uniref:YDG domain-containing protein n=1 Tax=Marasmiellus scandens TaxID=2682957 RepID=A0ABR1J0A9_9AGAR
MGIEAMRERLFPKYEEDDAFKLHATPDSRIGGVPGVRVGQIFKNRAELSKHRVHGQTSAGIHGSRQKGAYSIVLSGKYEDDGDQGEFIRYTGTGGQKDSFGNPGAQMHDQTFDHPMNASLVQSYWTKRPVRVIRGSEGNSKYAPAEGYRYDGLYVVTSFSEAKGRSGHKVCQFELRRIKGQPSIPTREYARP